MTLHAQQTGPIANLKYAKQSGTHSPLGVGGPITFMESNLNLECFQIRIQEKETSNITGGVSKEDKGERISPIGMSKWGLET